MAVILRHPSLPNLRLPVLPSELTRTLSGWAVSDLDRPGRTPLSVPSSVVPDDLSFGYTARGETLDISVADHVATLAAIAASTKSVQLLMGPQALGLFRLEPPSVVYQTYAEDWTPSMVDVSLVLKRASESSVNVGPVKIRGRGRRMAG